MFTGIQSHTKGTLPGLQTEKLRLTNSPARAAPATWVHTYCMHAGPFSHSELATKPELLFQISKVKLATVLASFMPTGHKVSVI